MDSQKFKQLLMRIGCDDAWLPAETGSSSASEERKLCLIVVDRTVRWFVITEVGVIFFA